jgi:hypothetical protein
VVPGRARRIVEALCSGLGEGYYSVCHRLGVNKIPRLQRPVLSNILTGSGEQSVRLNMLVTYQAQSF